MCSHFEAPDLDRLRDVYGAVPDQKYELDIWPGYVGPFLRLHSPDHQDDGQPSTEVTVGVFGLLPHWADDAKLARRTFNARSETVAGLNSFRAAWANGNHAVVLARAIYEPDWRSGRAVATRITRRDEGLMGIAGLWDRRFGPDGTEQLSFTMLTINADDDPFFNVYHKLGSERRSVVILPNGLHQDWLKAKPQDSWEYLQPYPADRLHAEATS
jgi:putative SOS response-associated peptidase YedK